jgi:hypothetical protein
MMTPVATLSQQIAFQSVEFEVPFARSMPNMLGDHLRNVPKNLQFRSPFDIKGTKAVVPLSKALAMMKNIKKDKPIQRYGHAIFTLTRTALIFLSVTVH